MHKSLETDLVNDHDGGSFGGRLSEIEVVSRVEVEGVWCGQRLMLTGRKFHEVEWAGLLEGQRSNAKWKEPAGHDILVSMLSSCMEAHVTAGHLQ